MSVVQTGKVLHLAPIGLEQLKKVKRPNFTPVSSDLRNSPKPFLEYAFFANLFSGPYELCYDKEDKGFKPILRPLEYEADKSLLGCLSFPEEIKGKGSFYFPSSRDWNLSDYEAIILFCNLPSGRKVAPARIYLNSNRTLIENLNLSKGKKQDIRRRYTFQLYDFSLEPTTNGERELRIWDN